VVALVQKDVVRAVLRPIELLHEGRFVSVVGSHPQLVVGDLFAEVFPAPVDVPRELPVENQLGVNVALGHPVDAGADGELLLPAVVLVVVDRVLQEPIGDYRVSLVLVEGVIERRRGGGNQDHPPLVVVELRPEDGIHDVAQILVRSGLVYDDQLGSGASQPLPLVPIVGSGDHDPAAVLKSDVSGLDSHVRSQIRRAGRQDQADVALENLLALRFRREGEADRGVWRLNCRLDRQSQLLVGLPELPGAHLHRDFLLSEAHIGLVERHLVIAQQARSQHRAGRPPGVVQLSKGELSTVCQLDLPVPTGQRPRTASRQASPCRAC
jgi:hypothetical protein